MVFLDINFYEALQRIFYATKPTQLLLITGGSSFEQLPINDFFNRKRKNINIIHYAGLGNNPNSNRLSTAFNDLNKTQVDLIIAVGGGSVIDYAKLLTLYLPNQIHFNPPFKNTRGINILAPILAIPTTAGSGSEATRFAVLYDEGFKYSIFSEHIKPHHVIIDPILTSSMPPYLTACSGIDALCQSIESLWARGATIQSREYAESALRLIYPSIEKAVNNPDAQVRRAMAIGAYYAGMAINISKTTGPHAYSYHITEHYGIPHGEAVAMMIEVFIKLNFPFLDKNIRNIFFDIFKVQSENDIIFKIRSLKEKIGLRPHPKSIGINNDNKLNEFLSSVNTERLMNNPVQADSFLVSTILNELD